MPGTERDWRGCQREVLQGFGGVTEPEQKRKIIYRDFIEVFDAEAHKITDARWLAQGTIYPDRIEPKHYGQDHQEPSQRGRSARGDEPPSVRTVAVAVQGRSTPRGTRIGNARTFDYPSSFPGPGLAVRILGDITPEKVHTLQEADDIFIQGLRDWKVQDADGNETSLYHQVRRRASFFCPYRVWA